MGITACNCAVVDQCAANMDTGTSSLRVSKHSPRPTPVNSKANN